jgi:drug/metabolite transporter (DMT)-like permease
MTDHPTAHERQAMALLVFGAVCISFAPVFVKMIGSGRLGPTAIGFWRTLFGAVALFAWCAIARRPMTIPKPAVRFAMQAGFLFFLDLACWHRSILFTGAGMATILGNTQVFATSIFAWLFFKERLNARAMLAAVTAVFGVILLVGVLSTNVVFSGQYLWGVGFGLATGIWYASYILSLKAAGHLEKPADPIAFMAWTSLATAAFMGVASLIESDPAVPPDLGTVGLLIALGVVAQALGWRVISGTLARIRASHAALVLLLQPTLATFWGIFFFHESFSVSQGVGAVITLAAIYYGSLRK